MLGERLAALDIAAPRLAEAREDLLGRRQEDVLDPAEVRRHPPEHDQCDHGDDADQRARSLAGQAVTLDRAQPAFGGRCCACVAAIAGMRGVRRYGGGVGDH